MNNNNEFEIKCRKCSELVTAESLPEDEFDIGYRWCINCGITYCEECATRNATTCWLPNREDSVHGFCPLEV